MELAQELFLTAVVAVLVSFLIAKLVSHATSTSGADAARDSPSVNVRADSANDDDEGAVVEQLQFRERLEVGGSLLAAENRADAPLEAAVEKVEEFVAEPPVVAGSENSADGDGRGATIAEKVEESADGAVRQGIAWKVDEFVAETVPVREVAHGDEAIETECGEAKREVEKKGGEFDHEEKRELEGADEIVEKKGEEFDHEEKGDLVVQNDDGENDDDVVVEEKSEEARVEEGSEGKEGVEEKKVEIKIDDQDEDEEWEGIERSELEKVFAEAAKFVESGREKDDERLGSVGSDVQMELYGLHKVATEGPCREQPPMALKVSARAKWNAWQRLGNMNPEVAMEHYVALVSDRVPGWMEELSAGDDKPGSSEAANPALVASGSSNYSFYQPKVTEESDLEPRAGIVTTDWTGDSNSEKTAKER